MKKPNKAPLRPLTDLSEVLNVSTSALYKAAVNGHIRVIHIGARKMITENAFEYHRELGFGRAVPPFNGETTAA